MCKSESLAEEFIINAKADAKPCLQIFDGYGWRNSAYAESLAVGVNGWNAGTQLTWDIFDGRLTHAKVLEARARHEQTRIELDDTARRVELEARTSYSLFIEAQEVLEATQKVIEHGEEALRLANARYDVGTGTQLDVLSAETSFTEARTTKNAALHDTSSPTSVSNAPSGRLSPLNRPGRRDDPGGTCCLGRPAGNRRHAHSSLGHTSTQRLTARTKSECPNPERRSKFDGRDALVIDGGESDSRATAEAFAFGLWATDLSDL